MGDVVNLNKIRKARARSESSGRAEENRIRHGETKAEKDRRRLEQARDKERLDGLQLDDKSDQPA